MVLGIAQNKMKKRKRRRIFADQNARRKLYKILTSMAWNSKIYMQKEDNPLVCDAIHMWQSSVSCSFPAWIHSESFQALHAMHVLHVSTEKVAAEIDVPVPEQCTS